MRTMPRRARNAVFVLPLLVVASAATTACDLAMAHYKEKETAEWRKTYDLQPGGRLEISNISGKIDVEPATGNTIEIVAEKSARAASSEAAKEALGRIEIQETASPTSVRIETKVQRNAGGLFSRAEQRVHYVVKVPALLEVRFSTVNGGIELRGLKGRVTAEATNGGIKAHDVSGPVDASTTNGGVEVELAQVAESGVKLGCTNGGIELRLPADARATISARVTNGGISTDGVKIETVGESTRRRLDGRMNGGGPSINLEGTNGGIRISAKEP
jgi:bifunctional DNA-binding transcriptional regulator/antitoxin component of YhaV-PrlF toxin-antitoxin module